MEDPINSVSIKATVERQFSQVAQNYTTSSVHAAGEDLAQMVAAANLTGCELVLDAGSGAGHTALAIAPHVARVVSVDLSGAMLEQGRRLAAERGIANVEFCQGDAEKLHFADDTFDVITTRYSAHHWPHPQQALYEFRRLLRPGGQLLLSDIVSFDDFTMDTYLQTIELLRDPSHVRNHRTQEWQAMLSAAGFQAKVEYIGSVWLDFENWVQRMATPPYAVEMLHRLFDNAPAEVRAGLSVEANHSFTIPGALIRAG